MRSAVEECEIVVLENVHGLLKKRHFEKQRPVEIVDMTFPRLGFIGSHRLLNTMDFGFPQRRQQCWLVYVRGGCGDFDILWQVVACFHLRRQNASGMMMRRGHCFSARQGQPCRCCKAWPRPMSRVLCVRTGWRHSSRLMICRRKPWLGQKGPCLDRLLFYFLCLREQVQRVARYAYMLQKHQVDPTPRRVIFQVNQSFDYCPTGVDVVPCFCPNGKCWDSALVRPLSAHVGRQRVQRQCLHCCVGRCARCLAKVVARRLSDARPAATPMPRQSSHCVAGPIRARACRTGGSGR